MKKIFTVLCAFLVALTATSLTSCDDEKDNVEPKVVSFSCEPNEPLLELFDLTISYTDENGDTKSQALTGPFSKRLTITKFPASGAFKVRATLRDYDGKKVLNKNPKLTYSFKQSIFSEESSIQELFLQTKSQVEDLKNKLNNKSWEWSYSSDGVSMK